MQRKGAPPVTDAERARLFAYDAGAPLHARLDGTRRAGDLVEERFRLAGAWGETVPGVLTYAEEGRGRRPALLIEHGLNSGKDDERLATLRAAWARAGFTCVSIDLPAHGEREGGPLDVPALLGRPDEGLRFVQRTVIDLRRTVDYLGGRADVDGGRIGYVGFSMSTFLGVQFVAMEPRVAAACFALGGAGLFHALVGRADDADRARLELVAHLIDPLHYAPRIAPRPVLQVNGAMDEIVPAVLGHMLHAALGEPKRALWFPGGHEPPPDEIFVEMRRFLETSLAHDVAGAAGAAPVPSVGER